jgi:histidyl-tRNA synthetase
MASAPTIVESLSGEDAEHFAEVRALLDAAGVAYAVDPTLVRGLDYYTRTIFSFVCDQLGAQSEIGGGGRYDGLIEQLGGPATPAVGWAAGIERILLALDEEERRRGATRFVAFADVGSASGRWRWLSSCAMPASRPSSTSPGRALKGQLKHADRIGARRVVILEADGTAHCATWDRRAAPGRSRQPGRRDDGRRVVSEPRGAAAPAPNGYRDTWCGQVLPDRVDSEARVAGWVTAAATTAA